MNVLITGGAGYLGTELTRALAASEKVSNITVYDNLSRGNYNFFICNELPENKVRFVKGDILDTRKLKKYLADADTVIHLASKTYPSDEKADIHQFEQVNHWGTAELIYALEELKSVSKLIYLSDAAVYGYADHEFTEKSDAAPVTNYAQSKLNGEYHVQRLINEHNSISAYVLRCANIYGYSPSARLDSVINKFMFEAHFENRISVHGSGRQYRSFISVFNVVSTITAIVKNKVETGIYNLSQRNLQIHDLVETIKEIYPELEFIFINHEFTMGSRQVNPQNNLYQYFVDKEVSLKSELMDIQSHFSF